MKRVHVAAVEQTTAVMAGETPSFEWQGFAKRHCDVTG
jgi:hypothetical protein